MMCCFSSSYMREMWLMLQTPTIRCMYILCVLWEKCVIYYNVDEEIDIGYLCWLCWL